MINFLQITKHCVIYHWNISHWAYNYCRDVKDKPEIRQYITDSNDALWYCMKVKDRPSIRKFITDSHDALEYCLDIRDIKEVRKYIVRPDDRNVYNSIESFD